MKLKKVIKQFHKLAKPYVIEDGKGFRLKDFDPAETGDFTESDKPRAKEALAAGVEALAQLQERLYADGRHAVLLIFQAMDAAGKDGAIKHVMSGVNPEGCQVTSFKAPSAEELSHDYLWRCVKALPERGRIGIFNRSYYEEVLAVKVHPEWLARQKLPPECLGKHLWEQRYQDIRCLERYLARNGVVIRKFFLHLSKKEQKKRFLARIDDPHKNWKFSPDDVRERQYWNDYQDAYQEMIRQTAAPWAPWIVVPADHKWYSRITVGASVIHALGRLKLRFPTVSADVKRDLDRTRRSLLKE